MPSCFVAWWTRSPSWNGAHPMAEGLMAPWTPPCAEAWRVARHGHKTQREAKVTERKSYRFSNIYWALLWINVFACGEGRSVRAIPIYIDLYKVHSIQLHSIYHILPNSRAKTVHPAAKIFLHKCAEGSKVAMTLQWQIRSSDRWQIKTRKKNTGCGNRILLPRNPIA